MPLFYSDLNLQNLVKVVGLKDPVNAQDAATKAYVDSAVEGLAWKDSVRVRAPSNVNIASPGATIDGITMAAGDRVLLPSQTTGSENGLYIWNGAAVAMTRAADANTAPEMEQAVTTVEEGTTAGVTYRQTVVNGTMGTTAWAWAQFGTSAGPATTTSQGIVQLATQAEVDAGVEATHVITSDKLANWQQRTRRYETPFGDGSATQFDFTHNFGYRAVIVEIYQNTGNYETVYCDVRRIDINTVRVILASAPAINGLIIIMKL